MHRRNEGAEGAPHNEEEDNPYRWVLPTWRRINERVREEEEDRQQRQRQRTEASPAFSVVEPRRQAQPSQRP